MLLYRRPEVLLTLEGAAGLEPVADSSTALDPNDAPAMLYAHYRVPADRAASGTLILVPNRPQLQANEVTALSRDHDGWQAEYRCVLDATSGNLDEIVLDIPSEWQAPWICEPQLTIEPLVVTGTNRHRLLIKPPKPINGAFEFSVRGALRTPAGQVFKTPRIELSGTTASRRYLVLPNRDEEQRIAWETRGMEPAGLPSEVDAVQVADRSIYEVVDSRAVAVLAGVDDASRKPSVRLADYCVDWTVGRPVTGLASFDLEPAGRTTCPLSIPSDSELLQSFVDGMPANLETIRPGLWRVRLGSGRAPTRIQVLFRAPSGSVADSRSRAHFAGPTLGSVAVEQTVWRVFSASDDVLTPTNGKAVSRLEHARWCESVR